MQPRAGTGCGWTEAPRGMLWHRYRLDDDGTILEAKIVPPTSQNQASIEADLRGFLAGNLDLDNDRLRHLCEQAIRNHDPCISCATHFLTLEVERGLSDTLVIGLGNAWRGDDGAGPAVARGLLDEVPARVLVHEGEPIGLIEEWAGADEVIVVDAVCSGAPPGTIHRLDPLAEPMPAALSHGSTHAFGLAETIELARALDRLPPRLTVYGIEGERFAAATS